MNPTWVIIIAAILGGLSGAIAFLFKSLVEAKNQRIHEVVVERDYWRGVALAETGLQHLPALDAPSASALPAPKSDGDDKPKTTVDRYDYYSLAIQAAISVVVLVLSFWLIATPTEAAVNSTAFNLIAFVVGVWLGRGVDAMTKTNRKR